jgi:prepilin-type N-terminal cleavage/methylation domain-containing protein
MIRIPSPSRAGFTLIELLMVLAIIAILGSMIFLSTRDLLAEMKVQKTAGAVISAVSTAQQAAAARGLAYSVYFNNAIGPENPRWALAGGSANTNPDAPSRAYTLNQILAARLGTNNGHDIRTFETSNVGLVSRVGIPSGAGLLTPLRGSITDRGEAGLPIDMIQDDFDRGYWRLWSSAPADQWLMVMRPWQSSTGEWFQPKGGMPCRRTNRSNLNTNPGSDDRDLDSEGRPIGRHAEAIPKTSPMIFGKGGIYGLPLDATGRLPAGQRALDDLVFTSGDPKPRWDPYGVALGPRVMFERGTRLLIPQDYPEFRRFIRERTYNDGPTLASTVVGYNHVAAPWIFGGIRRKDADPYENSPAVQCVNAHPNSTLGVDACDPQRISAPRRFGWALGNLTALVGIASTTVTETDMPDRIPGEAAVYYKPQAILFITVDGTGMLTVERNPAFAN